MTEETVEVETIRYVPKVVLGVQVNVVKIEFTCSDAYDAQVLFEDLSDRLEAGEEISLKPGNRT